MPLFMNLKTCLGSKCGLGCISSYFYIISLYPSVAQQQSICWSLTWNYEQEIFLSRSHINFVKLVDTDDAHSILLVHVYAKPCTECIEFAYSFCKFFNCCHLNHSVSPKHGIITLAKVARLNMTNHQL